MGLLILKRLLLVTPLTLMGGLAFDSAPAAAQTIVNCTGVGAENPANTSRVLFSIAGPTCIVDDLGTVPASDQMAYFSGPTVAPTDAHSFYGKGPGAADNLPVNCTFGGLGPTIGGAAPAANQCRRFENFAVGTYTSQAEMIVGADTYRMIVSFEMRADNGIDILTAQVIINPVDTDFEGLAMSQQIAGSHMLFQQASQNTGTGVSNAIAERFLNGPGTQIGIAGGDISAYASLQGLRGQRGFAAGGEPYPDQPYEAQNAINLWLRGSYTDYNGDAFSGDGWNGIIGLDYLVHSQIVLGVLGGYESGDFTFQANSGSFDGTGFTAGAYVGVQLAEKLVADAFFTHTWLDYDNAVGTASGTTDATRLMVAVNVTGQYALSDAVTLEPNARLIYGHEQQDAYTLSNATAIAANSVDYGRLSLGPTLRYQMADSWSMFVSAHGELDLSSENQTATTLPDFDNQFSVRLGLGMDGTFANGWVLSVSGDVGGLGAGDYVSYSGNGQLIIPFE